MKRNRNIIYSTPYKNVHGVLQLYVYEYLLKIQKTPKRRLMFLIHR